MKKIFHLIYSKGQFYNADIRIIADYMKIETNVFLFYSYSNNDIDQDKLEACYPIENTAIRFIEDIEKTSL